MANETQAVIPTLHSVSTPTLTRIEDQVAYLIRFFFANPGNTSVNNESEMISFRKLNAKYGNNPQELCKYTAEQLQDACSRFDNTIVVDCNYQMKEFRDPNEISTASGQPILLGNYAITINVHYSDGTPVIPIGTVVIGEGGKTIDLKFNNKG